MNDDVTDLREALERMTRHFAYRSDSAHGLALVTVGLSALEAAFDALGWDEPHLIPESECDEAGCHKEATCGTPTAAGYRHVCGKHFDAVRKAKEGGT